MSVQWMVLAGCALQTFGCYAMTPFQKVIGCLQTKCIRLSTLQSAHVHWSMLNAGISISRVLRRFQFTVNLRTKKRNKTLAIFSWFAFSTQMDSFLEREKELMKLNDTLNQKCAITLAAKTKVSKASKVRKTTTTKSLKNVKSKLDAIEIKLSAMTDGNKHSNDTKAAADSVDNDIGNGNDANQPVTHAVKVDNGPKTDTTDALDNRNPIEKFLTDFSVESKLKLTDDFPGAVTPNENTKPTNGVSLIPNNLVRRNVSTDGIIKWVIGIRFSDSSVNK